MGHLPPLMPPALGALLWLREGHTHAPQDGVSVLRRHTMLKWRMVSQVWPPGQAVTSTRGG